MTPNERQEQLWKLCASGLSREHPVLREGVSKQWADITPQDLLPPWTPELLLGVQRADRLVRDYVHWHENGISGRPLHRWDWPDVQEDPNLTRGEQAFELILTLLREGGLGEDLQRHPSKFGWWGGTPGAPEPWNWVSWVEQRRECYRKRVGWLELDLPWTPFQVDINSPSLFLDVTGADVWQVIVDAFREDDSQGPQMWEFLQNMRMASLDYIEREIPGPHADPNRKHDPDSPLGYGTSLSMPSFGYRREHRSEQLLVGWAAAHNMDLFNQEVW